MKRLIPFPLMVLLLATAAHAQALPAARESRPTRLLVDIAIGKTSFYSSTPSLELGLAIEQPIGARFEADGYIHYSPDRKTPSLAANTIVLSQAGIFWATDRVGIVGRLNLSRLSTAAYTKHAWYPAAGVIIRDHWDALPGRFDITYVFPTGCQWEPDCKIQGNRLQGVAFAQEFRLYQHIRLGLQWDVLHGFEQGNPAQPSAGRKGFIGGSGNITLRYEFGTPAGAY